MADKASFREFYKKNIAGPLKGFSLNRVLNRENTWLGLDIGTHTTKIVQISREGELIRLEQMLAVPTPAEALEDGYPVRPELISNALCDVQDKYRLASAPVISVLPEKHVITRQIKMPVMPEEEIAASLKWEVEKYIPVPGDDLVLDFISLGVVDGEKGKETDVLLIAAPRKIVYPYCELMLEGGFQPKALDTISFALWRLLYSNAKGPVDELPVFACLDIGASGTNVITFRGDVPVFSRSLPIGGDLLTQSISQVLGVDSGEAERLKIEQAELLCAGAEEDSLKVNLDSAVRPVLTDLVREVRRCLEFCKLKWKDKDIDCLYITGGTAMLRGLTGFMAEQLEVRVVLGNPVTCLADIVDPDTFNNYQPKVSPIFSVAMGLALREVVE